MSDSPSGPAVRAPEGSPDPREPTCLQIGDLLLERGPRRLTRRGEPIELSALSFRLILVLAEAAPDVVSQDELMERVWPGLVVSPETVSQRVKLVRKALGDDAARPRYIGLVRGQGYRMLAPVRVVRATGEPTSRARQTWLFVLAAAGLLAISLLAYERWYGDPEESALQPRALAVLPFADLSPDQDQEYLGDGLAEEILSLLAGTDGLRVIARTSSFSFKGRNADIATIAERLNVSHVLEGSVRKSRDRLRITAQLIDASDSSHIWARTYERDLDDLFAVQSEIAAAVASALEVTLSGPHSPPAVEDLNAYERYLQGRFFYNRRAPGDLDRALRYYQQALEIAPEYARAWAGLAGVYGLEIHDPAQRADAPAKLTQAVQRALAADPRLAEVQARAAMYHWDWGDPVAALDHFRKAQALDSDDPLVLSLSAGQAAWDGRIEDAIELQRRVTAVDPLSTVAHANLGNFLLAAGRLEEAKAELLAARNLLPSTEPWWSQALAFVLILEQQFGEALELALQWPQSPEQDQILALVYHALGRQEEADAALERLIMTSSSIQPVLIAEVYAHRGDIDAAFRWLEPLRNRPANRVELLNVRLSPLLKPLQADLRWWLGESP